MKDFSKYSAIIIGAGDATGSALTKKFAKEGYQVCPVRRPRNIDKLEKLMTQEALQKHLALTQEMKIP